MFALLRCLARFPAVVLSGAMLLAASCPIALAQDAGNASQTPASTAQLVSGGWTLGCRSERRSKQLLCEASQTIAVAKTRETLLSVFVTPVQNEEETQSFVLRFQLPHGLNLPAGVHFQIDEQAAQSPVIQTSNQAGLFARSELTEALLTALKKGATMTVSFSALNGNTLSVPVTLSGFSAVFAKLQ